MVTWDDFDRIWARTSPLTPYEFSDPNYSQGWNFVGSTPPARQMWDSIQKKNDEKFKYLRDNFGTPNIVTSSSQMTDTDKVYVYMGSEAGWNSGHWYYYNEGTSSWEDGGVYNSVAFVTDTTLSIAGQPADAKATGDALALKADLAGCTFTGNVAISADLSVTGDSSFDDVSISGTAIGVTPTAGDNTTKLATTEYVQTELNDYLPLAGGTVTGNLSVNGTSTLTGNVSAGADVVAVGDVSSANIIASNNANIGGNATVTGSVASASLTTTADGTIGGNLSVAGTTTLTGDVTASADLSVAGDSSLTNLSVSGTTELAGTSTAPTPSADDNSTKIATTEYVQTEIKPIETDVTINDKRITNIEKLLQGNLYDYQTDNDSKYTKSVPAGAMPYAGLEKVGGKTVVWNQLGSSYSVGDWRRNRCTVVADSDSAFTATCNSNAYAYFTTYQYEKLLSGHVYLYFCEFKFNTTNQPTTFRMLDGFGIGMDVSAVAQNTFSQIKTIVTATTSKDYNIDFELVYASASNVTIGDTFSVKNYMLIDLTLLYGVGNEPSTVAEFESMFPASYYSYNAGTLLSAGVTDVVSKDGNNATLQTIPIPAEIQALEGYGWSAGTAYNYVDFERKVFVQNVGSRAYASGDESDSTVVTDMTTTYYPLTTAVETDISAYLTDDNLVNVESGGTLTFPNQNGTDYRLPVPSDETYMIDLQEAINNG